MVLVAEKGLCPVQASLKNTHRLCDNLCPHGPHRMHLPAVPSVPAALPRTGILWILKFETQNTRHSESARGAEKLTASVLRFYTSKAQKVNAALHYRAVFNYSGNYPPFLQCT